MTVLGLIIGAIVALALSAFFSGTETGVYCLNHVRLNVRAAQKHPGARRLTALGVTGMWGGGPPRSCSARRN